jgi:hypothetical protein
MEKYEHDTFDQTELLPTIKAIEVRLRKLGCTKDQVRFHLDQVTLGRQAPEQPKRKRRKQRI